MPKLLASSSYAATPQTPHWQLALGSEGVVQQLGDISQSIRIILTTPKGSDPLRPDFGCDALNYLDLPLPAARPHLAREIRAALAWEPRIRVEGISIEPGGSHAAGQAAVQSAIQSGGRAIAHITWSTADLAIRGQTTSVSLGGAA